LLGEVDSGRDPAVEHDKAKADKSLGVVLDQFMGEHAKKLKPATVEEYQRLVRLYVKPREALASHSQGCEARGREAA
jgi:hypothetical protein